MNNFSKKFLIILLCCLLSTGIITSSYYKSVNAFEYVSGALAFEEAFKWLFAILGITAGIGVGHDIWEAHSDEFIDYAIENGATQTEVANWQLKLCEGILDKGSIVWNKFKSWINSLFSDNNNVGPGASYSDTISYINNYLNINIPLNNSFLNYNIYSFLYYHYISKNYNYYEIFLNTSSNSNDWYIDNNDLMHISNGYIRITRDLNSSNFNNGSFGSSYNSYLSFKNDNYISSNFNNYGSLIFNIIPFGNIIINNDLNTLDNVTYENLDIISSTDTDLENTEDKEVFIPFPGLSDSDDTISSDTYDDIIGRINDGTISYDDGIAEIQDLLKVLVYDGETDEVIPIVVDPETGENETIQDKIQNIKDNMGFTLGGLENVFPFCIPFDIYAFMTLLVADPITPVIDYPIKSVNNTNENIHIDLSPFEPVAVVVRYVFDFLFIIGLGVFTRSLIGAGGSD